MTEWNKLLYESGKLISPITGKTNKIVFADDTASGRPCTLVDECIRKYIYPYYSNTHSNASCGMMMSDIISKAKSTIRNSMNLRDDMKIFFSGNGCTSAINFLSNQINIDQYDGIFCFITDMEHYSNHLPWKELENKYSKIKLNVIRISNSSNIKDSIINNVKKTLKSGNYLYLLSLIGCSNVTGRLYHNEYIDVYRFIVELKEEYSIYLLIDYACSAPYINIDASNCDGLYFSGHKFLGGCGSPGVLIVTEELLQQTKPISPGGGCIEKYSDKGFVYKKDHEERDIGGTPNIVGIARLYYCLIIKKNMYSYLHEREKKLEKQITSYLLKLRQRYSNLVLVEELRHNNLPIFPISIKGAHYNLVVALFNDLFAIQTRGGVSCCGMYGETCKNEKNIDGWCRITFSYLMTNEEVKYILKALAHITKHIDQYKKYYDYDFSSNHYICRHGTNTTSSNVLLK